MSNPSLSELQNWLRWVITDARGVAAALQEPSTVEPSPRCLGSVAELPPLPRIQRLDVYAEAYFARIVGALEKDYATLRRIMGEMPFRKLVADYLEKHPSTYTSIGDVGHRLAAFLSEHEYGLEIPQLADLAALEWAVVQSFYADDLKSPPLTPERLAAIAPDAWPRAVLATDPSVRLLRLQWPVQHAWYARNVDEGEEFPPECPRQDTFLVVHRRALTVHVEELSATSFRMLEGIVRGLPLGEVCREVEASLPAGSAPPPVMDWFSGWVLNGIVRDIRC